MSRQLRESRRHRRLRKLELESLERRELLSGYYDEILLLQEVSGASAAYGLRLLSDQYAGNAIAVRRASDNATATIGFTASGHLDMATLDAFAGTSDVYVTTWFDQTGHGGNLTQSNVDLQPLIVSTGTVLTDLQGRPRLQFEGDMLEGTGAPISNQDLTAFFVQQAEYSSAWKTLLGLGDKIYNNLQYAMGSKTGGIVYIGDGSSWTGVGDTSGTLQPAWRSIQVLDAHGQTVRYFRNQSLVDTKTHTKGESVQTRVQVGSYDGFISEIVLFPGLSESERLTAYNDINSYFVTGPSNANNQALLPQDWQYQVDLYNWLKTITLADVTTAPGGIRWDGTYQDVDQLANLWVGMSGGTSEFKENSAIIRALPEWFVLDSGTGTGIEETGTVKIHQSASAAAFWYTQDLTLADGGQGNPYFQDPAVAMRALVSIAVDMMMHDRLQDGSPGYWSLVDFAGGAMDGWLWAYQETKHLLDAPTRAAFEQGFGYMAWKMLQWGAHDINGNMDTKAIAALARVYELVDDPVVKDWTVRGARKILFGSETGTPETTDYKTGLYRPAGYIDEGDSPDTTYNGVSLYHMLEAYTVTCSDPQWAFLQTVIESMLTFKTYQYFPDPDGFWDGPSGYAGRTGGSYVYDQRDRLWREITAAASFEAGRPLLERVKSSGYFVPSQADLVQGISTAVNWYNPTLGTVITDVAPNWQENHWPAENLYLPNAPWYSTLRSLIESSDPALDFPFESPDSFNHSFADEFWAYKASDGQRQFGYFVETLADPGYYKGWYGGSLQTFWTPETGMIILARHDKSGGDVADNENTRVWSEIDTWATQHLWGRDETGKAFSTAATDSITHPVDYDIDGQDPSVSVATTLGAGSTKGQQTGAELTGSVTFTNQFQALADGLQVTHTLTSDGSDQIRELWATLPVYLRNAEQQSDLADATIEYWNGSQWRALGTSLVNTPFLRLGRDFGQGPHYVYVVFDQDRSVKLSASVWQQSYQGQSRVRNVHIDLHGSPGTTSTMPTSASLQYALVTSDPVEALNAPPQLTLPGAQTASEDVSKAITGISVADEDAGVGMIQLTLSVAHGTLTFAQTTGLTFTTGDGTGDASMVFTGTLANVNAALATASYLSNVNYVGSDTLSITVDDQGNTGTGGAQTDSGTVSITVSAVNDAPVLTVPGAQTTAEDTGKAITGISVADADAGSSQVKLTMSVGHGTMTLARTTGLTFTTGDGTGDASLVFTGTISNINAALATVNYAPSTNYAGSDTLNITADDQGNAGSGGAKTDNKIVAITVSAVNDAPILTVPGAQSATEDTAKTITGISIADVDAASAQVKITMSVANGRLTVAQTIGLSFSVGDGSSDSSMVFTGTVANVNAALASISYLANANYAGSDTLNISVDDQGNTGSGGAKTDSKTVAITVSAVNDAPILTVPGPQSATEDTAKTITGISVADVDAASGSVKITMSVASGRITLAQATGLTFTTGDGTSDASMVFTGTVANVNAALASITYLANANFAGSETLSISVDDQGNTGSGGAITDSKTVAITVSAVNDNPVLTVPGAQTATEDTAKTITGISVADVDAASGSVKITMSVANGRLTLAQVTGLAFTTGDGTSDASMVFTGTVANVNAALASISYLANANYSGSDTLSISVDDQGNTGSGGAKTDSKSVAITVSAVNDAPVLTVPGNQSLTEGGSLAINGISISDVDAASSQLELTLSAAHARLTLAQTTGLTFTTGDGTSDATMTLRGTLANLNAALATLTYQADALYNGNDTISLSVSDLGNTGTGGTKTDSESIVVSVGAVNDPPQLTLPGAQTVNEDATLSITGISVSDPDAGSSTLRISMSVAHGRFTLARTTGLTFTSGDGTSDTSMIFTGTLANINAALATVSYLGNANYSGPDTLAISVDDQGNTGSGGAQTDDGTVSITVSAVNDAPVLTVPGAQSATEDTAKTITGISLADVDAGSGSVKITMSVANGRLTLAQVTGLTFTTGDGTSDASMVFTGTVTNVNAALASITYLANANFSGSDTLSITADDQGNTGSGGAKTNSRTVAITVSAVNDDPVLTVPGAQTATEDTAKTITGISVADVDAASGSVKITMSVANGRMTLAQVTGLTFTSGDGTSDASMVFTGTLTNVNAALASISYLANANYSGSDTLNISVDDQGNTGSGGAKTDSKTVAITVSAVNDTPVLTVPGAQTATEDTAKTITGISVADVDAASGSVKITMSVANGRLTLAQVTGLTFTTGDGTSDASMVFTGTVANVNAALASISYLGNANYAGSDTLSVSVDDQGNTGSGGAKTDSKTVAITVSAVNDAPVLTVPGAQAATEDTAKAITGISVADVDAASGSVKITMSVTNGRMTLAQVTGLTFTTGDGTSDASMVFTGTLTNVNAALASISYLANANFSGSDTLSISVDDQGNTGSGGAKTDSRTVAITVSAVNDAPTLTLPGAQSATEDVSKTITGISVSDIDAATGSVQVTIAAANGRLTLAQVTGLTFTTGDGTSDATMAFTGTLANVNAALATVTYLGNSNYYGSDTLSVTVDDQGNTGTGGAQSASGSITITLSGVNDAPVLTVPGSQATEMNASKGITGISIADVDAASGQMEVTLSATRGLLTLATTANLTFTLGDGTSDAAVTMRGTRTALNTALATLTYTPAAEYQGNDTIQISVSDLGNTGTGGAKTDSESIAIEVGDAEAVADLIGWWRLSEGSGTAAADSSPYGANHPGTLVGNPLWNSYGTGGSITLDGQGDGITIASSTDLNMGTVTTRTVTAWFYVDDKSINSRGQVIFEEGGDARGLSIYVFDGRLYVGGWNNPATESNWAGTFLSTDQIQSGQWHHVALVLNGTTTVTAGALRAYLDGVEFASGAGSQLWGHLDPTGVGQGAAYVRLHNGLFDGGQSFDGMIDDVRVYNRTLSTSEISELAAAQLSAPQHLAVIVAPDSVWENGSAVTGTLTRSGDVSSSLVVTLTSSLPGRLGVPATVTFSAGQASRTFQLTPQNNAVSDGNALVTVSATAASYISGQDSLEVLDDEPATGSLVAYWAFNEGSGTVATDTSPNGLNNSGTLQGDTTWSPAGLGRSVQLDGNGDYIAIPDSTDINTSLVTQRTISLWFAADDVAMAGRKQVLFEEGGAARGLNIYLDGGRLYVGGWKDLSGGISYEQTYLWTDQIQSDQWHNVVLVLDASAGANPAGLRAYLDGELFGSGVGFQLDAHADNTGIGQVAEFTRYHTGEFSNTANSFAGLIDEVRVYNRALGAAEIQILAGQPLAMPNRLFVQLSSASAWENGGALQGTVTRDGNLANALVVTLGSSDPSEATVPATVTILAGQAQATFTITPQDDALSDGTQSVQITASASDYVEAAATLQVLDNELPVGDLVAHWALNEASGTTVTDSSPNGLNNTGTMGGSAVRVDQGLGRAVQFDGQSSYIAIADSSDINGLTVTKRTVSLWFAAEDASIASRKQVLFEEGGITRGLNIYLFDGRLYVGGWNSPKSESAWLGTFLSTDQIQSGQWHHVVLVLDGGSSVTEGALRAYLDGELIGSGAGSQVWAHGDNIGLGQVAEYTYFHTGEASSATHSFAGMIDEVRVYNRALSAPEVQVLAGQQLVIREKLQVAITADSIAEQGGTTQATVTRTGDTSSALVVSLASSDTGEATVPSSVTILAGSASASFTITAVNDTVRDGGQQVTVTATATNLTSGSDSVVVADDELVLVNGVASNVSNSWITVTLPQTYTSMVVVATPNYTESHIPVVTRIRNATGNSFQLRVDRTDELTTAVPGISVHYVVADEGVYTQAADGVKMEVVKYNSTATDFAGSWLGESRSYAQSYVSPVVLGQVQTYNDADFSVFWSRGATSSDPASSSVLRVGKHVGEDTDTTRSTETVGYVVLEAGKSTAGSQTFLAGVGAATVQGMDNNPPFAYTLSGLSAASTGVASLAGMYGAQGGWAVLYGAGPVSASRINLASDEDQALDSERSHATENVSYLVFADSALTLSGTVASEADIAPELTLDAVQSILVQAAALWQAAGEQVDAAIDDLEIQVRDLPGGQLAKAQRGSLLVDLNAAGAGWFVDPTPGDSAEYRLSQLDSLWTALDEGPADGRVDLLSVLAHELGHLLGLGHEHDDPSHVMSESLGAGVRRLPSTGSSHYVAAVDRVFQDNGARERIDLSRFLASSSR